MEMYFSFRPTQWAATVAYNGRPTKKVLTCRTRHLYKFTQPAFRFMATSRVNLHSCQNRCVTMAACGYPKTRKRWKNYKMAKLKLPRYRKRTAIITLSAAIPHMETWYPAM